MRAGQAREDTGCGPQVQLLSRVLSDKFSMPGKSTHIKEAPAGGDS